MMSNNKGTQLSLQLLEEVKSALKAYCAEGESSDLTEYSKATYIDMADSFVRWLNGDFHPGSRKAPYRASATRSPKSAQQDQ
jgi:hypothetical protein